MPNSDLTPEQRQDVAMRILNAVSVVDTSYPRAEVSIQLQATEWALIAKALMEPAVSDNQSWQDRYARVQSAAGELTNKLAVYTNALHHSVALLKNILTDLQKPVDASDGTNEYDEALIKNIKEFLQFNNYFSLKPGQSLEPIDWQGKFKIAEYTLLIIRSWTDDFPEENGNYENVCSACSNPFLGHKRRLTCRVCAIPDLFKQKVKAPVSEEDLKAAHQRKNYTFGAAFGHVVRTDLLPQNTKGPENA